MKILAVGAHPDDIEFGAGGTLAKHAACGDEIHILVLTSGETGLGFHPTSTREREAREAAMLLDADLTLAHLPDSRLPDGKQTIDEIEAVAAAVKPDIGYIHSVHDTHQDHRAAAHASRVALRGVTKLYAFQAPSATTEFQPHRYPDITNFIEPKLELIRAHKSQCDLRRYMEEEYVTSTAEYWGIRAGCRFTEPMEVIADRDASPSAF
jgi:LmbE family N-acetylglucosaminyl deacetylase